MRTHSSWILAGACSAALAFTTLAQTGAGGGAGATGSAGGAPAVGGPTATGPATTANESNLGTSGPLGTTPMPGSVTLPATTTNSATAMPGTPASSIPGTGTPTTPSVAPGQPVDLSHGGSPSTAIGTGRVGDLPTVPGSASVSPGTIALGPQPLMGVGQQPVAGVGQQPVAGVGQQPPASTDPNGAPSTTSVIGTDPAQRAGGVAPHLRVGPTEPIRVSTAPPTGRIESQPPSTGDARVWVPGAYHWDGSHWVWFDGTWATPPNPGATWVSGTYDAATRTWTPGHWQTAGSNTNTR